MAGEEAAQAVLPRLGVVEAQRAHGTRPRPSATSRRLQQLVARLPLEHSLPPPIHAVVPRRALLGRVQLNLVKGACQLCRAQLEGVGHRDPGKCNGPDGDGACPHEGHRDGHRLLCVACQNDRMCMGPDGDGACPHEGHRDGNMRLCVACQKDKASRLSRPCKGWQEGGCPRHNQARLRGRLCQACNKAKWRAGNKE